MTDNFPTMGNVADEARSITADIRVPGGQLYSNEVLTRPIQSAVRKAYALLRGIGGFQTTRVGFCQLPAQQSVLMKQSTGLLDMITPLSIQRRSGVSFYSVTAAAKSGKNLEITLNTAHGKPTSTYLFATLTDIPGFPLADGVYNSYVSGTTTLTILGCDVTGTFAADATKQNQVCLGTESFSEMVFSTEFGGLTSDRSSTGMIDNRPGWSYDGAVFQFRPYDQDLQLRIRYYSSGNIPETLDDTIEIPASIDFLAHYALMIATTTRMPSVSMLMKARCFGNGSETRAEDGLARDLFREVYKTQQNKKYEDKTRPGYGTAYLPWQRSIVG